ncbi:MAG TPA: methyl-coenzyme M reductase family protein, partial [Candidatus Methanomethylicus sp.]|nr:methyl-coenzyme M reductase family protein [Candidatus Methanomethylicus sp.]
SELAGAVVEERRRELDLDPLVLEPTVVKDEVERQIPEAKEALSPNPVTLKIDGVRIKLQYDDYKEKVSGIVINGKRLGEYSVIKRSQMRDYILVKVLPASMFQ